MSENEIIARGIVAGVAMVLPFLGIAIGRWHSWKGECKFWKMMHKDLDLQNERLFGALKEAQDFVAELKEERRWKKCSEELPEDGEIVIVLLGRTPKTRGFFLTSRYVAGGWTYGEDPQGCKPTHWLRIPKAPKEGK